MDSLLYLSVLNYTISSMIRAKYSDTQKERMKKKIIRRERSNCLPNETR